MNRIWPTLLVIFAVILYCFYHLRFPVQTTTASGRPSTTQPVLHETTKMNSVISPQKTLKKALKSDSIQEAKPLHDLLVNDELCKMVEQTETFSSNFSYERLHELWL